MKTIKKSLYILFSVLLITDISSQIIYTDIPDTTVKAVNNSIVVFDFDMNNDASNDFSFELADVTSGTSSTGTQAIKYVGSDPIRGVVGGAPLGEALNLPTGDTVYTNQDWDPMVSANGLPLAVYLNGTAMAGAHWSGGITDGYLGVKFMIGTTLVYGWVRIDIPNASNEITLKDFAYESSGTYIIVGEGGPCIGTNILLNASSTSESSPGANDGTASVSPSGGAQPYSYNWSNGANTSSINGLTAGPYTVTVTDANGCFSDTTIVISSLSTIVKNERLEFSIFPNPSNGDVQISTNKKGNYSIIVRNLIGQELMKLSFNGLLNKKINLTELNTGIYLITITGQEFEKTRRMIIK